MIRAIVLLWVSLLWSLPVAAETLRLAVTTSFENSGLADVLLPEILADTGIDVQLLVVGTGQALRLGAAGDVDAVLVHAPDAEIAFLKDGHATSRRPVMVNDFVILGPVTDPAGVIGAENVSVALQQIATAQAPFVSRGDDSGTHRRERALWQAAGLDPETFGSWYRAVGAGMGAALNTAAGMNAYVLADRGSWLNFANKADLAVVFSGDAALLNQYSYLAINPGKHDAIISDAAKALGDWLTSDAAAVLIDGYRINGERLFTFNGER